jgi:hypothetical protein
MSTPTVGRFLPGYTGTRAAEPPRPCLWQVDRNGELVCVTRRTLEGAVGQWAKAIWNARSEAAREVARKNKHRAMREHEAHRCEPRPVGGFGKQDRLKSDAPHDSLDRKPSDARPVSQIERASPPALPPDSAVADRIALDRLHQAVVDAAISYGIRTERRLHAEGNVDVDAALKRLTEAHTAYHRALDRYQPGRRPIDHYLPGEEPRG